jgi:hypothetical protein
MARLSKRHACSIVDGSAAETMGTAMAAFCFHLHWAAQRT